MTTHQQKTRKRSRLKIILITGIVLLLAAIAVYWYISTEKFADTKDRKSAFTVNAIDFIREFEQDNNAANQKYDGKIVTVNGIVSETEAADTTLNIKFIDTTSGSYAIFAFQERHLAEAKTVKPGDSISVKGSFSAGVYSRLRKTTSISFQRSTLNQ